jgi:hypothetical protein
MNRARPLQANAETVLTWVGKAGYAARGAVYALVGALVLWYCALGGPLPSGSRGALSTLEDEPLGAIMLSAVAAGLVAYAVWRLVQGVADADRHGHGARGLVIRAALIISGLAHLPLAWSAVSLVRGLDPGRDGSWAIGLMQLPGGRWVLAAVGVTIVVVGVANAWRGWKSRFMKWFTVSQYELGLLYALSRFGLVARGMVFVIIGGLMLRGAWRLDASQARGMGAAFVEVLRQPFGLYLLIVVGLGMLAFAVYSLVEARYRQITLPPEALGGPSVASQASA